MKSQLAPRRPAMRSTLPVNLSRAAHAAAEIALLCAIAFSTPVRADAISDVTVLMKTGQFSEALNKADAGLTQSPRDKQLRFLKGVLLTELNRASEAIVLFTKLTEDFPELPEPYNNLAVLFAANGQYDKARAALEMAIRTNPTYATAHENLGDVYAKLASQAYDKALQLDSGNTTAKSKLTLIRTLVGNSSNASNADTKSAAASMSAKTAASPAPTAKTTTVALAKAQPKVEPAKPEVKPEAKVEAKVEAKADVKSESKVDVKADTKAEEKQAAKPVVADAQRDEVLGVVNAWAKAWSAKDVASYLGYYVSDYQPANKQSHKAWVEDRRVRIEGKGSISVKVDAPKVSIDGTTATVRFRQQYVSNQLRSNGPKTLVLSKQAGKWQIRQEHAGS